jgi:hypothetical protein
MWKLAIKHFSFVGFLICPVILKAAETSEQSQQKNLKTAPLKTLRVLIEKIPKSKDTFEFSGQALMSDQAAIIGAKKIKCRRENTHTTLASSLLNL